jgi:phosphoribosylglycinamide formyltransferase-1
MCGSNQIRRVLREASHEPSEAPPSRSESGSIGTPFLASGPFRPARCVSLSGLIVRPANAIVNIDERANFPVSSKMSPHEILQRLRRICLALPEAASEQPAGHTGLHVTFRARKKVFAYFLNDHHGDGIVSVACKVHPGDNTALVASQPDRFYLPAYIGPRGWVALRLDRGKIDWTEVKELVGVSYELAAANRRKRVSRED